MNRILKVAALTAVLALAFAGVALAAFSKVTGGTTTITASSAAAKVLADNSITVTPIAPATASGASVTFPISGGRLNVKTDRGVIRHKGGLSLSNGTKTVAMRKPVIVSDKRGVSVFALVRGHATRVCRHVGKHHARLRCLMVVHFHTARIARVTNVTVTGGKATGTVHITEFTARVINGLASKHVVSAGAVLGTATVAPTLG